MQKNLFFERFSLEESNNFANDFLRTEVFFENYSDFIDFVFLDQSVLTTDYIKNNSRAIHFSRIISFDDYPLYKKLFKKYGFLEKENFRSVILEKELRERYPKEKIVVNIQKIIDNESREIEVFIVSGLSSSKIRQENLLLRHFAIEANEFIFDKLKESLLKNNFLIDGGGENKTEGSLVLYFRKKIEGKNLRIELFRKRNEKE